MICALAFALVISFLRNVPSLAAASLLPVLILCAEYAGITAAVRELGRVNRACILIVLFLPITYPGIRLWGIVSVEGLELAGLVIWKLNLISVVMARLVISMGTPGIDDAMAKLRVSLKMRMLITLTARYILLLSERISTMARAIRLRAPASGLMTSYCATACMIGTTLVHSSDRAERASLAVRCRGGMGGFAFRGQGGWTFRDSLACLFFAAYLAGLIALG
jgi:energy-coupling factor transporter transmembrane protein EcfT